MSIRISLGSFLDYVRSSPRGCVQIVKTQRKMYLDTNRQGWDFYNPFRAALRRALNSPQPQQEIATAFTKAGPIQQSHFEALQAGFERWWTRTRATGVRVTSGAWTSSDLTVSISGTSALGLRYTKTGTTEVILPYLKDEPLTAEEAGPALRVLECEMDTLVPGAVPMVLDVRRGQPLRLRRNTNRDDLDALLAAESAKYAAHWQAAA